MLPAEMGKTIFQNENCDYPDSILWHMDAWEDRQSKVWPLGLWLTENSAEFLRKEAKLGIYDHRTDGVYEYKVHANIYADAVKSWEDKGMYMRRGEMANICWFAMFPQSVKDGTLKDPRVVIVLHNGDYSDPNWMMDELEYYRDFTEAAILAGDVVMLYVASDGPDRFNTFINVNTELASVLHIAPSKVYMDVSHVYRLGKTLKEIPDFVYTQADGTPVADPDACVEKLDSHPILDVSGRWANTTSNIVRSLQSDAYGHPLFSMKEFIHSDCGRAMVKGVRMEYQFRSGTDPELLRHWTDMGISCEEHFTNGERWLTFVPSSAKEHPERKLPLVLTFVEVTPVNTYQDLVGISYFYEYFPLVADGKCVLLFYAMESPEDNDFAAELADEACRLYPLDPSRIYVTGHSHNGHFASEFARRHHDMVAAYASLGMEHGIPVPEHSHEVVKLSCEDVSAAAQYDLPQININGYCESELAWIDPESEAYHFDMIAMKRRYRANRCRVRSEEEIRAARKSDNYVTRMLGVPTDSTELQTVFGRECYIGDVLNEDGKAHLRLVTIERMVHIPSPQMPSLSWNFMSRFARNRETGDVIELW